MQNNNIPANLKYVSLILQGIVRFASENPHDFVLWKRRLVGLRSVSVVYKYP